MKLDEVDPLHKTFLAIQARLFLLEMPSSFIGPGYLALHKTFLAIQARPLSFLS